MWYSLFLRVNMQNDTVDEGTLKALGHYITANCYYI